VGVVARIRGGPNQRELSLEDQEDHAKDVVDNLYGVDAEVEFRVIATKGKGERLDRPEMAELEAMIRANPSLRSFTGLQNTAKSR
jgi:site-specific DNA recombinase